MLFFINKNLDYTNPSNLRTYNFEGYYIDSNRLVKGNMKLYNILIFDMPAVETCLNCEDCKDKCYALKASRLYPFVSIFRKTNLALFNTRRLELKRLIIEQLETTKIDTIRIHSSGDFFSQEYISFWKDIIKLFPNKKFYCYTKVRNIFDFSELDCLTNMNIIDSVINDIHLNFGSIGYCETLKEKYNSFICPATKNKDTKVRCGLNCSYCVTEKNVCFVEH